MPALVLKSFAGIAPKVDPTLLPDAGAQSCVNALLGSGALNPWPDGKPSGSAVTNRNGGATKTVYVRPSGTLLAFSYAANVVPSADQSNFYSDFYWSNNESGGCYYTRSALPGESAETAPAPDPALTFALKMPKLSAIGVSPSDTVGVGLTVVKEYLFVITLFNRMGWESAPSPGKISKLTTGYTLDFTFSFDTTLIPANQWSGIRIYASATGDSSVSYRLVKEVAKASLTPDGTFPLYFTYALSAPGSDFSYGYALATQDYDDLSTVARYLVKGHNGLYGALVSQESATVLKLSKPFVPYAWPALNRVVLPGGVIGLGHFVETFVVLTNLGTYVVFGQDATTMRDVCITRDDVCIASRSVVSTGTGVMYLSARGVMLVDSNGIQCVTDDVLDDESLYKIAAGAQLANAIGHFNSNRYILAIGQKALVVSFRPGEPRLTTIDLPTSFSCFFTDTAHQNVLSMLGTFTNVLGSTTTNNLYQFDFVNDTYRSYTWRSKKFVMPQPMNFGWGQVIGQRKKSSGSGWSASIKLIVDGQEIYNGSTTSSEPFRLGSGRLGREFEIEIISSDIVRQVAIATSAEELAQV